ncbi:uncharacterized protein [Ptychodera flava]|uniref:uncharacterized protein isoform X2 n=1 Tax=Ptychodera flava TaxID=63121 RepID=UPI00396A0F12
MLMSTKRLYTILRLHINNRSTYRNDIIRSGCVRTVSFGPSLAATHQLQRDKIREELSFLDGETSTKTNISTNVLPRRYCQVRYLSSKKKGPQEIVKSYRDVVDVDSSDEDNWNKLKDEDFFDDDYDPEQEDNENDSGEPKSWKDVTHTLSGFRADKVIAAGLGISRKQVEDAFLSGKLRFNGEILTKKSRKQTLMAERHCKHNCWRGH